MSNNLKLVNWPNTLTINLFSHFHLFSFGWGEWCIDNENNESITLCSQKLSVAMKTLLNQLSA